MTPSRCTSCQGWKSLLRPFYRPEVWMWPRGRRSQLPYETCSRSHFLLGCRKRSDPRMKLPCRPSFPGRQTPTNQKSVNIFNQSHYNWSTLQSYRYSFVYCKQWTNKLHYWLYVFSILKGAPWGCTVLSKCLMSPWMVYPGVVEHSTRTNKRLGKAPLLIGAIFSDQASKQNEIFIRYQRKMSHAERTRSILEDFIKYRL